MKNQFRQNLEQQKCARCRWWEKCENYCHLIQRFVHGEHACAKWEMARKRRETVLIEKKKKTEQAETAEHTETTEETEKEEEVNEGQT